MRHLRLLLLPLLSAALFAACDDGTAPPADASAPTDAPSEECPSLDEPLAMPGDPIDGDTWDTFAEGFFATYCTDCHGSGLTGTARRGAPDGFDWDDEAAVRTHAAAIRSAVGVTAFMPPTDPMPTCDERARLVRWIDADAP